MSKVVIASGVVTGTHAITCEFVVPTGGKHLVAITWPEAPSVVSLRDFAAACDAVLKVLAEAQAKIARIRAEGL